VNRDAMAQAFSLGARPGVSELAPSSNDLPQSALALLSLASDARARPAAPPIRRAGRAQTPSFTSDVSTKANKPTQDGGGRSHVSTQPLRSSERRGAMRLASNQGERV
jgi:hypothetical protein